MATYTRLPTEEHLIAMKEEAAAPREVPLRVDFLLAGVKLTSGDRNIEYGDPLDNFDNIALLWSAYLYGKYCGQLIDELSFKFTPEDVAWMNTLQKMARTFIGNPKPDTYIDAATYSAIAGEVAIRAEED